MTDPKEIREQINKLGTDMKAMLDKAKAEGRAKLSNEEAATFDRMDADREGLIADERRALRAQELEAPEPRKASPIAQPDEVRGGSFGDAERERALADQDESLRAWFAAQLGVPLTRTQEELCKRHGVNLQSKQITLRSASRLKSTSVEDERQWVRRAMAAVRNPEQKRAMTTLSSTSPEDGNYLIANEAMRPLERALLAYGSVRNVATVLRTRTGANLPIPTNNDTGNEGTLLAETVRATEGTPVIGQTVLGAYKFTSGRVLASRELFQDSSEDLGSFLFSLLGERLARGLNRYATTGTGSSQPMGIVAGASNSSTQLAAKTPTYLELVAIEASVDPAYRNGAMWMFHDTMLQEIKKIVESTTGRPIWLPTMAGGAPDSILGYRYSINQHMEQAAASGAAKSILFGQMQKYLYREVSDIEIMRLDELYAEYYQVGFVGFARMDGDLLDAGTHPVKYALNKA